MICGALQTLNEEACEDVLEETEETTITLDQELPQTSVIPPSPDYPQGESLLQSNYRRPSLTYVEKSIKKVTYEDDVDFDSNRPIGSKSNPTIYITDGDVV